jgi:uncharacterized protein (DUF697 family)
MRGSIFTAPHDKGWHMTKETTGEATDGNTNDVTGTKAMTDEERDAAASKVVDRFTLWSGAAALIPVPVADIAAVAGVQIQLLRRLSEIYGIPFSENRGKSIIAAIAGSIVPASTAATTTVAAVSILKSIPGIGTAIGMVTMPAFSACATYVIGKVFIQHFASGGTLLDFNPPDYREFIKAQKDRFLSQGAVASAASQPAKDKPSEI